MHLVLLGRLINTIKHIFEIELRKLEDMNRIHYKTLFLSLVAVIVLGSCGKDDPPVIITPAIETITTFRLLMFPDLDKPFQISYRDTDGSGPRDPIIVTDEGVANTGYSSELTLLDESIVPEKDINSEILAESVNYQIFYVGNGIDFTLDYEDEDVNGNPIGLKTRITFGDAADGSMTIIVRYNPTKNSSNNPTSAGGTTIAEVTIPLKIE